MDAKLKEERIIDERLAAMPFVHADFGKSPYYAIFRVSEKRFKTIPSVKGFIKHMTREKETPNADQDRSKNNELLYGPADLYEDTKNYLKDCKINKNSVIGRELLLTASPQFFKGMIREEFEHWKDINIEWLKDTFKSNLRAVYLHLDESSPHLHVLIIPKLMNEKLGKYTLQNYRYFNGYKMLRDMQDSYAEAMGKDFSVLQRGIKGSRAKHICMKKLYGIAESIDKETDIEELKAKATREELLKMKVDYMDKTLKSFQNYNHKKDETNEKLSEENKILLKQIEELKKGISSSKDMKEEVKQEHKISRGFSGKRYNKSV